MTNPLVITVDTTQVDGYFNGLSVRASTPSPAYIAIGEYLTRAADQNFARQQTPDGQRWASNSRLTIERYLATKGGAKSLNKKGQLNSKGALLVSSKKMGHPSTGGE